MYLLKTSALTLLTLILVSCATLSEDECLNMDWAALGYEDGAAGHTGQRIGKHREACAKYEVSPNLQSYNRGREDGLKEYCRPANAYAVGVSGEDYKGVCPSNLADGFTRAYEDGWHLHRLEQTVKQTNAEIVTKENYLAKLDRESVEVESELVNGDNTPEERQTLVDTTRELAEEIGHLHQQTRDLQVRLGREEYELALYRNTHVPRY
jgi:hypothetical protein